MRYPERRVECIQVDDEELQEVDDSEANEEYTDKG